MPYGAQKDKEFPRLLCPCNNLLLFRAQRNRQVPHGSTPHRGRGTVLFHLSEHRCPSLSTLAGPLSKQLVNVLGGGVGERRCVRGGCCVARAPRRGVVTAHTGEQRLTSQRFSEPRGIEVRTGALRTPPWP